jgi:hypothetical protein
MGIPVYANARRGKERRDGAGGSREEHAQGDFARERHDCASGSRDRGKEQQRRCARQNRLARGGVRHEEVPRARPMSSRRSDKPTYTRLLFLKFVLV